MLRYRQTVEQAPGPMTARERAEWEAEAEYLRRHIARLETWVEGDRLAPAAAALARLEIAKAREELQVIQDGLHAHQGVTEALYYRFDPAQGHEAVA